MRDFGLIEANWFPLFRVATAGRNGGDVVATAAGGGDNGGSWCHKDQSGNNVLPRV